MNAEGGQPEVKAQILPAAVDAVQSVEGAHRLGDDGGPGHTCNAHVEPDHKQQVQPGVQHRRHHQKIEGPPGVAHGPENAGAML